MKCYRHENGDEKVLAMLKGGTTSLGVVLTQELSLSHTEGGVQKVSAPQFSHSVAARLPLINDRSLIYVTPLHQMRHESHTKVLSKWLNKEK